MTTKITRIATLTGSLVLIASLAACGAPPRSEEYYAGGGYTTTTVRPAPVYQSSVVTEFGRVANIETTHTQGSGRTSGAGAVIGAVVGGVLGNAVGGGTGRAAATAVGVLGGAVAGNAVERRNNSGEYVGYRVSIQLDQGGYRAYDVPSPGDLRIGDRVRMMDGQIQRI
ncbi:outer membrane lipoprotein SlyB [Acidovorax soli]|uniref:Outer membrane lipoprotein SlyB n=1 Tax=Acidovorax soli TaxID=592050 RepID=A0A7X0PEG0_9BURK|nr:glycine zipper 2TM domain-containing protein [Acidovorax soli]MBB6560433.1 outer membrane lipoprotein SlyB [Acidovorax soli]